MFQTPRIWIHKAGMVPIEIVMDLIYNADYFATIAKVGMDLTGL